MTHYGREVPHEVFEIRELELACGRTLRPARIAYRTYGQLNAGRSNAVLYPTWYSGRHWDNEWLIGEGRALDPARWFVIVPNMLGNGLSTSPSTVPHPDDGPSFPPIRVIDNVAAQHRLVTELFGIERLALVLGWSMGAGQTYQWAVSHPEMVQRMLPFCGSPRTAPHNRVFLDSLRAALTASAGFDGGRYTTPPVQGLRAFARIYAGWGFSQAFYWEERWRELGFTSLEDFVVGFWEGFFLDGRDPNNLLTMLDTWWHGDVGATPGFGSTEEALASIRARAIVMPAEKDLYFPPEDEAWAVSQMTNGAELRVIPGVWGHFAGGGPGERAPDNPDTLFIDAAVAELLAGPSGI
ncbi:MULTISPECIES: alpha/beta fold hydrolase [unclassified Pseudonocardia]|uniref:alpha/beta fold hydrolase n=1 Tax=unclassified Pseudonocardia TaxID=2619320 RepID=UPI0001FFDF87|nr:alpha/beta fold hydrolase [Pseudonocardia sp. Ae707_Ps1]OLM18079.1 Homoserine O-acetyltransferase [Pseudonocardia sp. Ae707_Ps1]